MNSTTNEERLIRQLFHCIDSREWDRLGEFFHCDVVYDRPGYTAFAGIQELTSFYMSERVIASGMHTLDVIVAQFDHAACWGHFAGMHRNGSPVAEDFADGYTFQDGLIMRRRSFFYRAAI